jgi:Domain of unknown function (DUF1992)
MDLFHLVSEERIKKAYKDGEFENLAGFGKPLQLEDLSGVPEELRMAYKIMKNAGYTQEESHLRQEMMTIEDLIEKCDDSEEKENLQSKLNEKLLRFNRLMSKRGKNTNSAIFKNYQQKVNNKLK